MVQMTMEEYLAQHVATAFDTMGMFLQKQKYTMSHKKSQLSFVCHFVK